MGVAKGGEGCGRRGR